MLKNTTRVSCQIWCRSEQYYSWS